MPHILNILEQAFEETVSKQGVVLAGGFFSVTLLRNTFITESGLLSGSITQMLVSNLPALNLPSFLPSGLLYFLTLAFLILPVPLTVASFRAFNSGFELKELQTVEFWESCIYLVLTGLIATLLVSIGSLLLIIPGIYLAAGLFLTPLFASKGDGLRSLKKSWSATKGHKLGIFGLMIVLLIITGLPAALTAYMTGAELTLILISSFETVLGIAAVSKAFKSLQSVKE